MEEEFYKLPWNTVGDSEDSDVNESYLKTHSSTYKILHGTLQKVFSSDSESEKDVRVQKDGCKNANTTDNKKRFIKFYIPGFVNESKIKYPKPSVLNKDQQAEYLNLMLRYDNKLSHALSAAELRKYNLLHENVVAERYEFTNFVKNRCSMSQDRYKFIDPDINKFVEELWQHRLTQITQYPAVYEPLRMLPLVYADNRRPIVMKEEEKTLLQLGSIPYVIRPNFRQCVGLHTDYVTMTMKYRPDGGDPDFPDLKAHKEQVSEDKNAEKLAIRHGADVVISANALKNIADNHGPLFDRNWDIPVIVRECVDQVTGISRKVVFVDKPFVPRTLSTAERNLWFYRIGVKSVLCHKNHPKILTLSNMQRYKQENTPDTDPLEVKESENETEFSPNNTKRKHKVAQSEDSDVTDDGNLVIDFSDSEKCPSHRRVTRSRTRLMSLGSEDHKSPPSKQKTHLEHPLKSLNISNSDPVCKQEPMDTDTKWTLPPVGTNVSYKLWKLYKESVDTKGNFLKGDNTNREIKLLVRCKVDGYEDRKERVYVVPKIEYQSEYGAECLTKSEITHQWISLLVRPKTVLCRVRVNICSSEVIMIERRSLQDVAQESVRLYNTPVNSVLGTVYNILLGIVDLEPGNYLLSHTPRLGSFVHLRRSDVNGRINLHDMYRMDQTAESVQEKCVWNQIDHTIVTPFQQAYNRVPGTFPPALFIAGKAIVRKRKYKKKKKGQQQKRKAKQ